MGLRRTLLNVQHKREAVKRGGKWNEGSGLGARCARFGTGFWRCGYERSCSIAEYGVDSVAVG